MMKTECFIRGKLLSSGFGLEKLLGRFLSERVGFLNMGPAVLNILLCDQDTMSYL
jgi:hypothetical protein